MDIVFIMIQAVNILAMFLIIVLGKRYTKWICAAHKLAAREATQSAPRQ